MPFRLTWNRRRRSSLPSSSDNTSNSTSPHGRGEPSHEVVPCTTPGRTIYCQRFRLRWVDERCQECAVCYSTFQMNCIVALLPCGHYYCHECIDQWFYRNIKSSSKCPLCRYDCSKPLREEEEEDGGSFFGTVPSVAMVGDSSSSTDESSWSSEEGRDNKNDLESFVCCYQAVAFRAAATSSSTAMTAALLLDKNDPLASLVEKYGQRENFHLILSKALKAKQTRERQQDAAAVAAVIQTDMSSTMQLC